MNPKFTSQRCSQCENIDKNNSPDQATFVCTQCGYGDLYRCIVCGKNQKDAGVCKRCGEPTKHITVNADYNAARNLSILEIDKIIAEDLKENDGGNPK